MPHKESVSKNTIQRCPHDSDNPYTMVHNSLIRDESISPTCRLVLIYLLSHKNDWVIRPPQIYQQFKNHFGKNAIYKILNEAMGAGYLRREEFLQGNMLRYKYYLSETPKFKKSSLCVKSQYTGAWDPENRYSKERTCEEGTSLKNKHISPPPLTPPKPPPSEAPKPEPKKPEPPKPPTPKQSLRSEEEEVYACLENTTLSPKDKRRLCQKYAEPQVANALEIAKTQKIKSSLMALLINILDNPDKWDKPSPMTPQQQIAHEYNEKLRRISKPTATENEALIESGALKVLYGDGYLQLLSFKAHDFAQDIRAAMKTLDEYLARY